MLYENEDLQYHGCTKTGGTGKAHVLQEPSTRGPAVILDNPENLPSETLANLVCGGSGKRGETTELMDGTAPPPRRPAPPKVNACHTQEVTKQPLIVLLHNPHSLPPLVVNKR